MNSTNLKRHNVRTGGIATSICMAFVAGGLCVQTAEAHADGATDFPEYTLKLATDFSQDNEESAFLNLNSQGTIAGGSTTTDGATNPTIWASNLEKTTLPTPPEATSSVLHQVSSNGKYAVGGADGGNSGWIWNLTESTMQPTKLAQLADLAPPTVRAVDNSGTAIGFAGNDSYSNKAVKWDTDGNATELPDPTSLHGHAVESTAWDVSADGVIAGTAWIEHDEHEENGGALSTRHADPVSQIAVWFPDGSGKTLEAPDDIEQSANAWGISDNGQYIAGVYFDNWQEKPAIWEIDPTNPNAQTNNGTGLEPLDGYKNGVASTVNDDGIVGGYSAKVENSRSVSEATLWKGEEKVSLEELVVNLPEGVSLESVDSINNAGKAIGTAELADGSKTSFVVTPEEDPTDPTPRQIDVSRISGADRYETSLKLSTETMSEGKPVFVVTGQDFPDALSAGAAAASVDGSLVLTRPGRMEQNMVDLLASKQPSIIYLVGGTEAITNKVANQLKNIANVERIEGKTRFDTSVNIYNQFFVKKASLSGAFVATGWDYPDALTASVAGGILDQPVLLVNSAANQSIPSSVATKLRNQGVSQISIVGGTQAVPDTISATLSKQFTVSRLSGNTRYATNLEVNNMLNQKLGADYTHVWVATGNNFADALSAAVPAGQNQQRLVLSNGSCIPNPVVTNWIKNADSKVTNVTLTGGTAVLNQNVHNLNQCK